MARGIDIATTKVIGIPVAGVVNPFAPTLAELTANTALDLTNWLTDGTTIDYADSDTISEMSMAEGDEIVVPTIKKSDVTLVMFRELTAGVDDPTGPTKLFTDLFPQLLIYLRSGKASSAVLVSGDKGRVFKITADRPKKPAGVKSGFFKMNVKGLPAGLSGEFTIAS